MATENYRVLVDAFGNDLLLVQGASVVFGPTVTPEPATWLLLGSGLAVLAFARKKLAA